MTATHEFETLVSSHELPLELLRLASSTHPHEERNVACMVSGMVAMRHDDEVICPLMLRRNLLVPAHQGPMSQSAWRVD